MHGNMITVMCFFLHPPNQSTRKKLFIKLINSYIVFKDYINSVYQQILIKKICKIIDITIPYHTTNTSTQSSLFSVKQKPANDT